MRRIAAFALVGALALTGCGGGPKKPSPKDDPKTKASIEKEPEIELPSFDNPAGGKGELKSGEGEMKALPKGDAKPAEKK